MQSHPRHGESGPLDLSVLNEPQRRAVEHPGGPLLVLAGAGSGKTRVVTYRIAYLIANGVPPWRILAVTFTNKAAGEMRSRVEALVGKESASKVWLSTFHSFCARLLRLEHEAIERPRDFTIIDADDATNLIRRIIKQRGLPDDIYKPGKTAALISQLKCALCTPAEALAAAKTAFDHELAELYRLYAESLAAAQSLDFDDLLVEAVLLFRRRRDVLEKYRQRFLHVLVDEYQDTNKLQEELTTQLAGLHRNLCVVGDDDQSIYRWRGATVEHILEFDRRYPDAEIIKLEQNYRSTDTILRVANQIVGRNQGRRKKRLWTESKGGAKVKLLAAPDAELEAAMVADRIKEERKARPLGDIAVFYRTNAQSRAFEEALARAGVPHVVVGGLRFYERREVKDMLAYLRLVANTRDDISFLRVVNVPKRKIGQSTQDRIAATARERNTSLLAAAAELLRNEALPPAAARPLYAFVALIDTLRKSADQTSSTQMLRQIIEQTGYLEYLEQEDKQSAPNRAENVMELVAALERFEAGAPSQPPVAAQTLPAFLESIALVTDLDAYQQGPNAVTLMTLHTAKGLEYPVVFLTGLEEGTLPHSLSLDDPAALEEERRLCYVGITRAREQLYLSYAESRWQFGSTRRMSPSRFLNELPSDCVERVGSAGGALLDSPGDFSRSSLYARGRADSRDRVSQRPAMAGRDKPLSASGGFRGGDMVRHRTFGIGTVVATEGSGANLKVTVQFRLAGRKTLMQQVAKLVKVE